jgi:hypothetical protein
LTLRAAFRRGLGVLISIERRGKLTSADEIDDRLQFEGIMTPTPMAAQAVLDREYLEIRAKILELGASFDRLDRGAGSVENDPRMKLIREALSVLQEKSAERAEQIQLIFSRQYDDDWQKAFHLSRSAGGSV